MLSPTEKKGAPKPTLKNPKLASMTNIANRSPLNKNEAKEALNPNSLSKKHLFDNPITSPRNSAPQPPLPPQDAPPRRTLSKPEENQQSIEQRARSPTDLVRASSKGGKV
jgi:hypothetical protein